MSGRPAAAALLVVLVLAVFGAAVGFDFVSLDDPVYVTSNPRVLEGPSWDGFRWAWSTTHASNWHPLTWLSLQIDAWLGGGAPWAFHATNVILHAVNVVLLYLALAALSGAHGRSWFVAAVFAVHPLRAESVAWIVERKDVLGAAFGFALLLVYARGVTRPDRRHRALEAVLLALALLAKPVWVVAPVLLLILDAWPLRRLTGTETLRPLVVEKAAIFALSVASGAVTLAVQSAGGAVASLDAVPLGHRLSNAVVSLGRYLTDAAWPTGLAVFYPLAPIATATTAIAALALAGVTLLSVVAARTRPYLLAGWLWYLTAMLPVVGLVQVGSQARADRYTYLPLIGIAIMVAWGATDVARGLRLPRWLLPASAALVVAALAVTAHHQTRSWRNSITLFEHALRVTRANHLAHAALGSALAVAGRWDEAEEQLEAAMRLDPRRVEPRHERAVLHLRRAELEPALALWRQILRDAPDATEARAGFAAALWAAGDRAAAERECAIVLAAQPHHAGALATRASILLGEGRGDAAESILRDAIRADPSHAAARATLGGLLVVRGAAGEALPHLEEAIRLEPGAAAPRVAAGQALAALGRTEEALAAHLEAIRLRPEWVEPRLAAGVLLFQLGRTAAGRAQLEDALRLDPTRTDVRINLGVALWKLGDAAEARAQFRRVLEADPTDARARAYLRLAEAGPPVSSPP